MKVSTILDQIDDGAIALPVFQRGYVWNRDQVRGLLESLYRRHPVGSLLTWVTKPIPRWDVHFGVLKTTERIPQRLISPHP